MQKKKKQTKLAPQELTEFVKLEEELHRLQEENNIPVEHGKFHRFMDWLMEVKERPHPVQRKKYLWLALLTGWMGGHRFYAKQYITACIYLALFWSGVPAAMTIIDLMAALPKQADEQGMITV